MLAYSLSQFSLTAFAQLAALLSHLCSPPPRPVKVKAVIPNDGSYIESFPWGCCQ
jgi:hypothetical protein